ncbi:hypothetical protein CFN78_04995 [Amycolatopsis antarctica]|uniref:Transmembrane protein n=1 Tax=Amycolatopsis antarctica TaxID=1854586 RepID=A0A263DAF6_9PSEU|nr:hypothetical protein [Amycolatopsis antarctica]OZM74476.1 hypothetical protein CFN78_04995 [Amycolatopsis antarctica]
MPDTTGGHEARSEADAATDVDGLAAEIDQVGARTARTVVLGQQRAVTIALAVLLLVAGLLLPWVGEISGWQVLVTGDGGAIPRLFAATATLVGVVGSVLALLTRRWWLTWVGAVGGWFASVDGMLAVWSQQSSAATGTVGGGPGAGMILSIIAMVVLAVLWMRTAWSRT